MPTLLEYLNNEYGISCESVEELIEVLYQEDSYEGILYGLTDLLEDYNDLQNNMNDDLK